MGLTSIVRGCWQNLGSLGRGAVIAGLLTLPFVFGGCYRDVVKTEFQAFKPKDFSKYKDATLGGDQIKKGYSGGAPGGVSGGMSGGKEVGPELDLDQEVGQDDKSKIRGSGDRFNFTGRGGIHAGQACKPDLTDFIFNLNFERWMEKARYARLFISDSTYNPSFIRTGISLGISLDYIADSPLTFDIEADYFDADDFNPKGGGRLRGNVLYRIGKEEKRDSLVLSLRDVNLGTVDIGGNPGLFVMNKYFTLGFEGRGIISSYEQHLKTYPTVERNVSTQVAIGSMGVKIGRDIGFDLIGGLGYPHNSNAFKGVTYEDPTSGAKEYGTTMGESIGTKVGYGLLSLFFQHKNQVFIKLSGKYSGMSGEESRSFHTPGGSTHHEEEVKFSGERIDLVAQSFFPFFTGKDGSWSLELDAWARIQSRNMDVISTDNGTTMSQEDYSRTGGGVMVSFVSQSKKNLRGYLSARERHENFSCYKAELNRLLKKQNHDISDQFFCRWGIGYRYVPKEFLEHRHEIIQSPDHISYFILEAELAFMVSGALMSIESRWEMEGMSGTGGTNFYLSVGLQNWYNLKLFLDFKENSDDPRSSIALGASIGLNW